MISTIICGLSDVLVPGLSGIQKPQPGIALAAGDVILERLVAQDLHDLYVGEMTEDEFCHRLLDRAGWPADVEHLRRNIREQFLDVVPGTAEVLQPLAGRYRLILLADQSREWAEHICRQHSSLMKLFDRAFFSYDFKQTKAEPGTFRMVLGLLGDDASECLLIDSEPGNIAAAAGAGIGGILFKNANQLAAALADRGIRAFPAG